MKKHDTYQEKNFDDYAQALRKNLKERRKKLKESSLGNTSRQVDSRASDPKQDD